MPVSARTEFAARGAAHVNSCESFHALLKRGVHGVYHHWSKQHLHRYLSEFDFRYNLRRVKDGERTLEAIKGFEGKRLMYKDPRVVLFVKEPSVNYMPHKIQFHKVYRSINMNILPSWKYIGSYVDKRTGEARHLFTSDEAS